MVLEVKGGRNQSDSEYILKAESTVSTTNWHLSSTSIRINSGATAAADLNTPWKEFRMESGNETLCASGKTGRMGLQIVRYFRS